MLVTNESFLAFLVVFWSILVAVSVMNWTEIPCIAAATAEIIKTREFVAKPTHGLSVIVVGSGHKGDNQWI